MAFLGARGGRAPSTVVVTHFSQQVGQAEAAMFRHLLHQVCRSALPLGNSSSTGWKDTEYTTGHLKQYGIRMSSVSHGLAVRTGL